jgi:hypothetical protein
VTVSFTHARTAGLVAFAWLSLVSPVGAQQRPLLTEDPEPIGAGRVLIEGGFDYSHNQHYPVSGLVGDLWRIPTIGLSIGISSIAEIQFDGGPFNHLSITSTDPNAPLANILTLSGDTTHDVEDLVVGTKIRLVTEAASRPTLGLRFATKLPNARNQTGLGLNTTDFFASLLAAKTVESIRIVVNLGTGILSIPTDGRRQNDVFAYGLSFARALTDRAEVVGEVNGRVSTRNGPAPPGTETRGRLLLGGRYTRGALRLDGAMFFGLNPVDPTVGFTSGFTYVFDAFKVP